ncbi:dipeptide/oligopeptide/nickel ABC transporter permease/ATP-binding protein [Homoserinibacter sp. GY 40078]|uniref:dipeptide/oligopeptide/nickel ABC transporter permease/ATP-binding protein n=1 Tax=Homoserinibacter sp. GY 40078 TaxID=2603275 RepID=UPI0011C9543D|nr:dipeptide/oligopeptide/nickel ABC transporter permease/ATP-binding protein [Homoserinibacter sp. GY 40078]TXK16395.1 dipeptide/oligopeptide/nickel ABC transporter permease/ATP-binding protein [Homoserinibacter sp. GY 40078]
MTESAVSAPALAPVTSGGGLTRRLLREPMAVGALIVFALIVLASILAPLLTPWDPNRAELSDVLAPPFGEHILGADSAGRDVLARLLYGGRASLLGALIALVVALAIGIPTGLIAGYYQRWFDSLSTWTANLLMSMPGLIVLLAVISVLGPRMYTVMAVFGILLSPGVFRLTRSSVMAVRKELYIDAAKVSGVSDVRIIGRHVLGVVRAPLVIQASMMAGIAIVLQAGLEFLGVGDSTTASWGQMLNDAFTNIYVAPTMLVWPGLMIGITVGSLALFGTALRDAVQGTTSVGKRRRPQGEETVPAPVEVVAESIRPVAEGAPLLLVEGLRVGYPAADGGTTVVVDGVDLRIARGEVHGVVGESGSGKSQTAFSILGLLPVGGEVLEGSIHFDGVDLVSRGRERELLRGSRIGYIPQEPMSNLDPAFTLGWQLVEPMRRHLGLSRSQARTRALDLLDRVGIADPRRTFDAHPHEVSGGMAQRVLIAGAVSCDPDLLIADEPTTALDVTVQAEVLDLLRSLQAERSMGVMLVTHNFGVVADLCDRVTVMQRGRVVESGTANEIFSDARHPYTRMLLDSTLEDASVRPALTPTEAGR